MDQRSTILAACTPPGHSPRGTVRLSGDLAWVMVSERIDGDLPRTRGVLAARFRLAELSVPILILRMPGPASYTGEDTLELQLPGHPVLIQEIMTALLEDARDQNRNARVALAGEFTARAFLNQRLDLLEAESVAARVAARSDDEIRAARVMQDGRLRRLVEEATTDLVRVLVVNGLAAQEYSSRYAQAKRIADLRPVPDEARPSKQQLQDVAWWVRRKKIPPLEAIQDQLEAERWLEAMQDKRVAIELVAE